MKLDFAEAMRRATLSTRANDVVEATKIILRAVTGRPETSDGDAAFSNSPVDGSVTPRIAGVAANSGAAERSSRPRGPLGDVLRALREGNALKPTSRPAIPDGAQFLSRSFTCPAGARDYKLYVPASAADCPRGVVVMLHGCKQDPNDFAVGTNMNAIAERHGLLVAYPSQTRSANTASCWNWFNPADQVRDAGEPAIIAGLTRDIVSAFGLDRCKVFVAGLSAGGAMAAVMSATYPDLYAAAGIHSGLAYRSASDVISAFAAMRGAGEAPSNEKAPKAGPRVRTIVFHGARDRTVHPANADRVVDAARSQLALDRLDKKGFTGGRHYTSTIFFGLDGVPFVELWRIVGAGHAWSGGNPNGSFADSKGPDASAEMVRFFLTQATDD